MVKKTTAKVENGVQTFDRDLVPGADLIMTSDLPKTKTTVAEEGVVDNTPPIRPSMTSPAWSDYVMTQFDESELNDGRPNVGGLRRVTELLLGPITKSVVTDYDVKITKSFDESSSLYFVVATHLVEIDVKYEDQDTCGLRTFSEVGNVSRLNTEPEWLRWAPEFASTRAEARALRKALKLQRVISSEENAPSQEELEITEKTPCDSTQRNFLINITERNGIDLVKYINYGKNRYGKIEDVPYKVATKMAQYLSELQRDQSKIPEEIKK